MARHWHVIDHAERLQQREQAAREAMQIGREKPIQGLLAGVHIAGLSKPIRSFWRHPLVQIIRWATLAWAVVAFGAVVLVALG